MASIKSQMALDDGVSRVLNKIVGALDLTLNSFEKIQRASGQALNAEEIDQARLALVGASQELQEIADAYQDAAIQEERLNRGLKAGESSMDGLLSKAKGLMTTLAAGAGIQKIAGLSDQMTSTTARLSLMVDDGDSVTELESKIMASAQRSRAYYLDTASAIASMGANAGSAFSGNDELIAFMEQVNKQFVIGGATAQGQSAAMLQLTQAMAAGALRGEELNSILENAPGIARAIESYMGVAEGSIKKYAEEGLITADVVKNALFSVADETNAKFESMPLTWAQVWTNMQNKALTVMDPVLNKLNQIANSGQLNTVINAAAQGLTVVASVAGSILGFVASIGAGIVDNWSIIGPFVWAAVAALGAYYGIMLALNTAQAIQNGLKAAATFQENIHAAALAMSTGATFAQTVAQYGLNAALLACPITWIVLGVLALVAIIYAAVAAVNKFAGTSVSATGIIAGAVAVVGAFIGNTVIGLLNSLIQFIWMRFVAPFLGIVEWILNVCNGGFNSFGDAVANLIGQIIGWFLNLGKIVTTIVDAIFGTNWTAGLEGLQNAVTAWGKNENAITLDKTAPTIEHRFEYGAAWDSGYDFGQGIENSLVDMFKLGAAGDDYGGFALDQIAADTGNIADSTGGMADALEISNEQLEYMRDIAERDAINRFTTAEVKIDMTGMTNKIDGNADLDGVLTTLTDGFAEALVTAAEGVHA